MLFLCRASTVPEMACDPQPHPRKSDRLLHPGQWQQDPKLGNQVAPGLQVRERLDGHSERMSCLTVLSDHILERSQVHSVQLIHAPTASGGDLHPALRGTLQEEGPGRGALQHASPLRATDTLWEITEVASW